MVNASFAPDYADPAHWLVRPGVAGFLPASPGSKPADLFYVHPTTVEGPALNQDFADTHPDRRGDLGIIARQITAFASACRVFAPRYRQATSMAFRLPGIAAETAYDFAYQDVRAAFSHYLRCDNERRGFILAGHSQGALHIGRLLHEVIEAEGLQRRMVAAYAIGIGFSEGLFGKVYRHILPCLHPGQTGCLVSWNCFLAGSDASAFLRRTQARDAARLGTAAPGLPVCLNPLSFDAARPQMCAADNPGTMTGEGLPLPPLVPGLAGVRCHGGVAWVSPSPSPVYHLSPLPGGNMHMHEISLFHAALQQDTARRVASHA
jgi:hypothetical protein